MAASAHGVADEHHVGRCQQPVHGAVHLVSPPSWYSYSQESDIESIYEPSVVSLDDDDNDAIVPWVPFSEPPHWGEQIPVQETTANLEVAPASLPAPLPAPLPIPEWALNPPLRASEMTRDIAALRPQPEETERASVSGSH